MRHRLVLAVGLGAIASGCAGPPATPVGAVTTANVLTVVTGSVFGPAPGLLSARADDVAAHPTGGLVSLPGAAHGATYHVRHADDLTVAEGRQAVSLVDLDGRTLSVKPAATDPLGAFRMTGLAVSGVAFVKVSFERDGRAVTLLSAVSSSDGPTADVNVDPATTLAAHHLAARLRAGATRPDTVSVAAFRDVGNLLDRYLSPRSAAAGCVLPEAAAAAVFEAMGEESPALGRAIAEALAGPAPSPSPAGG